MPLSYGILTLLTAFTAVFAWLYFLTRAYRETEDRLDGRLDCLKEEHTLLRNLYDDYRVQHKDVYDKVRDFGEFYGKAAELGSEESHGYWFYPLAGAREAVYSKFFLEQCSGASEATKLILDHLGLEVTKVQEHKKLVAKTREEDNAQD